MTDTKSLPEAQVPEMVERVARGLWDNWRTLPVSMESWRTVSFDELLDWGAKGRELLDAAYSQAHAALSIAVEPTADMIEAVPFYLQPEGDTPLTDLKQIWRTMVKAALDG